MFEWINTLPIALVILVVMSYVVSVASDKLGDVLHVLGLKLNIPSSVRGATFDAISSSFPEFTTAMIAVLVYKQFADVGIPTVAGSAVFNILLIPMASIFAFKGKSIHLDVDRKVTIRDMAFYIVSIGALTFFTYMGQYTWVSGLVLVTIYVAYIVVLYIQTKRHQMKVLEQCPECKVDEDEEEDADLDMSYTKIVSWMLVSIGAIWFSIDALIQSASVISYTFNIPKYIVAVIILAACTSIPDTLLSVKSARKGDADGAISNAIGSNIFDICICLGLPMMIAGQTIQANFAQNIGVLVFVFMSMLTTGFLLMKENVGKKDAMIMFGLYLVFVGYIASKALGIVSF